MIFREKTGACVAYRSFRPAARRRNCAAGSPSIGKRLSHHRTRIGAPARIVSDSRLRLDDRTERMIRRLGDRISLHRRTLADARARLAPANPVVRLTIHRAGLEESRRTLVRAGRMGLRLARERLAALAGRLGDLSPLAVLQRGYALAQLKPGLTALRSSRDVTPGDQIRLQLAHGVLDASVDEVLE